MKHTVLYQTITDTFYDSDYYKIYGRNIFSLFGKKYTVLVTFFVLILIPVIAIGFMAIMIYVVEQHNLLALHVISFLEQHISKVVAIVVLMILTKISIVYVKTVYAFRSGVFYKSQSHTIDITSKEIIVDGNKKNATLLSSIKKADVFGPRYRMPTHYFIGSVYFKAGYLFLYTSSHQKDNYNTMREDGEGYNGKVIIPLGIGYEAIIAELKSRGVPITIRSRQFSFFGKMLSFFADKRFTQNSP